MENTNNPQGQEETPQEFAQRLGLKFNDWLLLSRALTHRSYLNEHSEALEDNERLEFLGDAVLDFIVGAWLYNRCPEMPEGDLTRLRSALVYTEQLAEFARMINLHKAMRLGRGEAAAGGRERAADAGDPVRMREGGDSVRAGGQPARRRSVARHHHGYERGALSRWGH